MNCDMCGKESKLMVALVEGTEMNVCSQCAKFGKIIRRVKEPVIEKKNAAVKEEEPEEEAIQVIVNDYAKIIKDKREQRGMKQEDFAKKINEKESLIHNIESRRFKPGIKLAEKIEKFLGIKLIEEYKEEHIVKKTEPGEGMTIGDMINLSKK